MIEEIIPTAEIIAIDLEPQFKNVIQANFLYYDPFWFCLERQEWVGIGNPPFGYKGKLAIDFINRIFQFVDTIGFILPLTFRRYSAQSKLDKDLRLIYDIDLKPNSFYTSKSEYSLATCFQIWTKKINKLDLRIRKPPIIEHSDFQMFLHNNTKATLKYFNKEKYNWDFAVVRQGFYNYQEIITEPNKLVPNRQYLFFKSKNKSILNNLLKIDFHKLASKQMIIKGFGKSDVIKVYNKFQI